jgi:hypothetical protein
VSSPSDPQPPGDPEGRVQHSTQEIPVVQPAGGPDAYGATKLPPHPGAMTPAPVAMDEPQPTGPVDFVPGLPGTPPVPPPAAPAPSAPAQPIATQEAPTNPARVWPDTLADDDGAGHRRKRRVQGPRDRSAVLGVGLALLSLVLLELGLTLDFRTQSYWSAVPLWSAFATLCAVLALLAFAVAYRSGSRLRSAALWRVAAAGLVGLAVFWLLVVLPVVASDRGFLLTAALGALGAALWVGPGRKS